MPSPEISIVLPVFEEEQNLAPLLAEIDAAMTACERTYEVVAVDDGSRDGSLRTLHALRADHPALRVIALAENRGQSAALLTGFEAARGAIVVTLDADLQNDPADIGRLLARLDEADVVSGVRRGRQDSWVRKVSSRIANGVRSRVLGDGIHDVGCSLKAYRRSVLRHLPWFRGIHRFLPALARLNGARIVEIDVHHRARRAGVSKYGIGNRLGQGLFDLVGVFWLQRRWVRPVEAREEGAADDV